jgi:hypothetical protein
MDRGERISIRTGSVVSRRTFRTITSLLVLALFGCQADEIAHYRVPRNDEASVRLLAAIFPQGEQSWVFKLQGPTAEVALQAEGFTAFLRSVRFPSKADPPVTWTLPEGWRRDPDRQGRFATLRLGPKDDALELTVTHLTGPEASSVLANVNRWRTQHLGLRPIAEAALVQVTKSSKVEGGDVVIVDMSGPGGRVPAPMPTAKAPPVPTRPGPLTFRKPDGWTEYRDPKGVAMHAFHAGENDQVEITVTRLPGAAGGLAANINRWRTQQLGLPPASDAELKRDLREIAVAGQPAHYVDLLGSDSLPGPRQRIVGVILPHDDVTWFFKVRGPADLVGRQHPAFEAFLGSVRFGGNGGE